MHRESTYFAAVAIAVSILLAACADKARQDGQARWNEPGGQAAVQHSAFEANPECSDRLEDLDLSAALAGAVVGDETTLRYGPGISSLREFVKPARPLTLAERRIAYGFGDTDGFEGSYLCQTTMLSQFCSANGRLPVNGAELVQSIWFRTLNDPEKIGAFMSCTPEMQLKRILFQVNAVTGKLHTTFTDPDWHPGGVYARLLAPDEFAALRPFEAQVFAEHGEQPSVALAVTYFGEAEGSVLAADYVTFTAPQDGGFASDPRVVLPGRDTALPAPPPAGPGTASEDPDQGKGHC